MKPAAMQEPMPYPNQPHRRLHGPTGYDDWTAFKPRLRDEFEFRCVFCRLREAWFPHGADSFSVEHLKPRSIAPELALIYDNMLYACSHCNSNKRDNWPIMDPCKVSYGRHFYVRDDGTIEALTKEGRRMVRLLQLDDEEMNRIRLRFLRLIRLLWANQTNTEAWDLYREIMGYPSKLPDLGTLRPSDNIRPDGISQSHIQRSRRGELPEVY